MLGSHIYYTNSFSAWQISGNDINSWKSRVSNLIVLVESEIKHKIYHKNIEKGEQEAISLQKMRQENHCFATRYLLRNR